MKIATTTTAVLYKVKALLDPVSASTKLQLQLLTLNDLVKFNVLQEMSKVNRKCLPVNIQKSV